MSDWGSHGWWIGRRRRGLTPEQFVILLTVVGLYYAGVSFVHWLEGLSTTVQHLLFAVGFLVFAGVALGLGIQTLVARARGAPEPTSDVVSLRFAVDATVAPRLTQELDAALRAPRAERLGKVALTLLSTQPEWRLVGLTTTMPLPESQASALFDYWAADARKRYTLLELPGKESAGASPYREEPLLVVCLHLETHEEIPDLREDDPVAVARTLHLLKNKPRTVRRADLWSSSQPVPTTRLRELDPRMIVPKLWT